MKKCIALASTIERCAMLSFFFMAHCFGSVVVLVRDPDGTLTGGVDSLVTYTAPSGAFVRARQQCKVFRSDKCVVMMTGILSGPGVDLLDVMKRECSLYSNVRQIASAFFRSATSEIRAAAPPTTLLKFPMVAAVIAPDRQQRKFEAAIVDFRDGVPRRLSGQNRVILYFGVLAPLDSFSSSHPEFYAQRSADQVVRRYLQVAATAQPATVGEKFSIFRIDAHEGFRWIDTGLCPDE